MSRTKFDRNLEELLSDPDLESADDLEDEEQTPMEIISYPDAHTNVVVLEEDSPEEKDRKEDYKYARTIYRGLLERGVSALELALMMAKESEHPRAFDSVSSLMKNIADINRDMLKTHDQKSSSPKAKTINNTQVNNYNVSNDAQKIENFLDGAEDQE